MVKLKPRLNQIACVLRREQRTWLLKSRWLYINRKSNRPLAGTLPLLIQIPIILGLIAVVYNPLQHLLHIDANVIEALTNKAMGT